ncbi:hypothetical protein TNCV_2764781 [Trichonephila clavipes]|nr:hypothetical protein TNCV_2764781 [Trichonephila clavipes]
MGYNATPTIFSRPGTIGLLFVPVTPKFLNGKTFTSNEEVKNNLDQFFASKDKNFMSVELCYYQKEGKRSAENRFYGNRLLRRERRVTGVCVDKKNSSRFRITRPTVMKFGIHVSLVESKSIKNRSFYFGTGRQKPGKDEERGEVKGSQAKAELYKCSFHFTKTEQKFDQSTSIRERTSKSRY